jgi:DNA-binding SARP family transcriptional activator
LPVSWKVTTKSGIGNPEEIALEKLESLWEEIRVHLQHTKQLMDEAIRKYPTPIPRCDAQFNHLLEQRTRLFRELERMGTLAEESLARSDYLEMIEEFIGSSPYTDDEAELAMRSHLKAELSMLGSERR